MMSYFPYMGAKSAVAEKLVAMMPAEASQSFIELFAGAGSVFFAKEKAKVNILNDLDRDVWATDTDPISMDVGIEFIEIDPIALRLLDEGLGPDAMEIEVAS